MLIFQGVAKFTACNAWEVLQLSGFKKFTFPQTHRTEAQKDRKTERQKDRKTDRQTDRKKERKKEWKKERKRQHEQDYWWFFLWRNKTATARRETRQMKRHTKWHMMAHEERERERERWKDTQRYIETQCTQCTPNCDLHAQLLATFFR